MCRQGVRWACTYILQSCPFGFAIKSLASLVSAPKQRLTEGEKAAIKEGKSADEIWENPKRAAQKDTDARWTIKYSRKKDNAPKGQVDIAIPSYGYKSHIMTDRAHGFIRSFTVTDTSRHDGAQLPDLVRRDVLATGSNVYV